MHVDLAMNVIAKSGLIAPFIRELIKRYEEAFIYGSASPDIVVGKKYAGYINHCHNWRMGWLILHEAESDRQRAAAYGYLMHLAADVVAHNYYIPFKIIRSYDTRMLTHTYWEMRFDLGAPDEVWDKLNMVTKLEIEEFDELLDRVMRKTLFTFNTNKKIFNSILMLQKMQSLRNSLRVYAGFSRFEIGEENRRHYMDITLEAVFEFLSNPEKAAVLAVDPTGNERLSYAKQLRRNMRKMIERGLLSEKKADEFVELVKERLAIGLYRPDIILPDIADVISSTR